MEQPALFTPAGQRKGMPKQFRSFDIRRKDDSSLLMKASLQEQWNTA